MEHLAGLLKLWPSSDGRLGRKGYWLRVVLPGVALAIFSWLAFFGPPSILGKTPQSLYSVACMVFARTADIYSIRRYHDLGMAGQAYKRLRPLIVILAILAFAVWVLQPVEAVGEFTTETLTKGIEARSFPPIAAPLAILGVMAAGMLFHVGLLALKPGQHGPNDYGPDPREPVVTSKSVGEWQRLPASKSSVGFGSKRV